MLLRLGVDVTVRGGPDSAFPNLTAYEVRPMLSLETLLKLPSPRLLRFEFLRGNKKGSRKDLI